MSKKPNSIPAAKPAPAPVPAPADVDDGITITAKPARSGGAIELIRKHLVSHPDASLDQLRAMITAAGLNCADGTLRTCRAQTLAILKFIRAHQAGEKPSTIEGAPDAIKYYVVRDPNATVEAIAAWLKGKGVVDVNANAVRSTRAATLAVMHAAA